jgi:antitoxin component YwqK of YwqJK toxin-antitoxin module
MDKSYYINDDLEGEYITYYESGKIGSKCNYKNGILEGICIEYKKKYYYKIGKKRMENIFHIMKMVI